MLHACSYSDVRSLSETRVDVVGNVGFTVRASLLPRHGAPPPTTCCML